MPYERPSMGKSAESYLIAPTTDFFTGIGPFWIGQNLEPKPYETEQICLSPCADHRWGTLSAAWR
jgi:hypothetical protein